MKTDTCLQELSHGSSASYADQNGSAANDKNYDRTQLGHRVALALDLEPQPQSSPEPISGGGGGGRDGANATSTSTEAINREAQMQLDHLRALLQSTRADLNESSRLLAERPLTPPPPLLTRGPSGGKAMASSTLSPRRQSILLSNGSETTVVAHSLLGTTTGGVGDLTGANAALKGSAGSFEEQGDVYRRKSAMLWGGSHPLTPRRTLSSMSMASLATVAATTSLIDSSSRRGRYLAREENGDGTDGAETPFGGMAALLQQGRARLDAHENRQQNVATATASGSPHRFCADE